MNDGEHTNSVLSFYSPDVDIPIFLFKLHFQKTGELNDKI